MPKRLQAATPIELAAKIYRHEGWIRKAGESRWERINRLYTIEADTKHGRYVATRKPNEGTAP